VYGSAGQIATRQARMKALIQRVSHAEVAVAGLRIAAIGRGILALVGVEPGDDEAAAERLLERVATYRIFPDGAGRMNLSLTDTGGGLLLVPQFTLVADTRTGTRPGFSTAAPPAEAERLFGVLAGRARARLAPAGLQVGQGRFGADMQVSLTNDGPVTFWLEASSGGRPR
jgi:D-tyrosyl-tRNA(Tyr) deacylase